MSADLYEFAAATTDIPWAEAEACGWFNCAEAGGWLRQLPDTAIAIEDPEVAVERGAAAMAHDDYPSEDWPDGWSEDERATYRHTSALVFRAAVGKE